MLVLGSVSPKLGVFNFTQLAGFQKETPSPNEELWLVNQPPPNVPLQEIGPYFSGLLTVGFP